MKSRWIAGLGIGLWLCGPVIADTVTLTGGERIEGVITNLDSGRVHMQLTGYPARAPEIDLREIESISFDSSHLIGGLAKLPLEHYLRDLDAEEMVRLSHEMNEARHDTRQQLDQIKATWAVRQPIERDQVSRWKAAKETFEASLSRYRGLMQDMYIHVLAQVDEYNKLEKEAEQIYVGVKGVFNIGSPLVPAEIGEYTVKESVPKVWYDRIYFDGYNRGYKEGSDFERLSRAPNTCEGTR
jgi:hypothetical protein